MSNVIETLVTKLQLDSKGFTDGLNAAKEKTSAFGGLMQGALMGVGLGAMNMLAGAAQSAVGYLGDAVAAASDMGETTSKVGVVFGDVSDEVIKWAENADMAFGQSKQQALDAASTFAIFGKSAGLSGEQLESFSTDFVGLASDLASFNNTTPEQAIQAIGAALRGETEPMRAYGVLLDDATMRQKALELGITDNIKNALTPQQKILAAQALIWEQTSLAQGDFARTSDGLANQQRILDAQWTNMQTTLGQGLLPLQLAFTQSLNQLVQMVLPPLSALLTTSIIPAMEAFGAVVQSLLGYLFATVETGDDKSAFGYIRKLPEWMQGPIQSLGKFLATFDEFVNYVFASFDTGDDKSAFGYIRKLPDWLQVPAQAIGKFATEAKGWIDQFGDAVKGMVDRNLNFFNAWIQQNMPRIQQIVQSVMAAMTGFWEAHGERITAIVQTLFGWLQMFWDTQFRTILNIVQVALQLLTGDFDGAGQTLRMILNDWRMFFESVIKTIVNGIRQWFQEVDWGGIGRAILEGIANGIRSGAGAIADAARRAAQDAFEAAKSFLGIHSPSRLAAEELGLPFAEGIGVGITAGMRDVAAQVAAGMDGMMGGLTAGITPAGEAAGGFGGATITQNFYGAADPNAVRNASAGGVKAGLRAAGRQ